MNYPSVSLNAIAFFEVGIVASDNFVQIRMKKRDRLFITF